MIDRDLRTKEATRELRESVSKDSLGSGTAEHLVYLPDSGLRISTR
jgi:hypothetical protein